MNFWWNLSWLPSLTGWVLVLIGILGAGYYFWRKAREEHYNLVTAFDGLIVASLLGLWAARASYLLLQTDWSGFFWWRFFNLWSYPGMWAPAGLVTSYLFLIWTGRRLKRDSFEIWDFYTLALVWFLGWWWLSRFVVGAAAGTATNLPWGIVFPQRVEPAHPVQIYAAAAYLLLFRYLWWAEPRFRFFIWYRSKKRTAKPGYLLAVFLIFSGLLGIGLSFLQYPFVMIFDFEISQFFSMAQFILGCVVLYVRSGQSFFVKKEKGKHVTPFASTNTGTENNS